MPHIEAASPPSASSPRSSRRATSPAASPPWPSAATAAPPSGPESRHRRRPLGGGRAPRRARADPGRRRAGPGVPRRAREHPAQPGRGRIAASCGRSTSRAGWPTWPGYSPDLSLTQKVEVLETRRRRGAARLVLGWAHDTLADVTFREKIKTDVEEGMEKTQREFLLRRQLDAIRKELTASAATAATRTPTTTGPSSRRGPARARPQGGRARGRQARAHQRPEPGDRLDPDLARHRARDPWGTESEDRLDIGEASRFSKPTTTGWTT